MTTGLGLTPAIPELKRLRQGDHEFKTSLADIVSSD